jgi:hypothetical protein
VTPSSRAPLEPPKLAERGTSTRPAVGATEIPIAARPQLEADVSEAVRAYPRRLESDPARSGWRSGVRHASRARARDESR